MVQNLSESESDSSRGGTHQNRDATCTIDLVAGELKVAGDGHLYILSVSTRLPSVSMRMAPIWS